MDNVSTPTLALPSERGGVWCCPNSRAMFDTISKSFKMKNCYTLKARRNSGMAEKDRGSDWRIRSL